MSKYKVVVARLMSGYREGQIIELPNITAKVYGDGFGGVYERVE